MLKRKVQSLIDCYLESATPPALQVNMADQLGYPHSAAGLTSIHVDVGV